MTDERRLEQTSERIERLLREIQSTSSPATWDRVQSVVEGVVALHGAAIERILGYATDAGVPRVFEERVVADDLVASVLVLHDLHPLPAIERARRALESIRPKLGAHAGDVELVSIEPDGTARVRMLGSCDGCGASRSTLEHWVRRAIQEAAPEVTRVTADETNEQAAGQLVQLRRRP